MIWPDFKRGDRVKANEDADGDISGKEGICLDDHTETGFGHKNVEVAFDDGFTQSVRTHQLVKTNDALPNPNEADVEQAVSETWWDKAKGSLGQHVSRNPE